MGPNEGTSRRKITPRHKINYILNFHRMGFRNFIIAKGLEMNPSTVSSIIKKYLPKKNRDFIEVTSSEDQDTQPALYIDRAIESSKQDTIVSEEYSPNQIFNVVATSLYWKKMPCKIFLEENAVDNSRDDRMIVLLGLNAFGDFKLKPLVVYNKQKPVQLNNYCESSLPVLWKYNSRVELTTSILKDWFTYFRNTVKQYCLDKGIPFKILLIMPDVLNFSSPLSLIGNENIEVKFLSINSTKFNTISMFKAEYLKIIFTIALNMCHSTFPFVNFWNSFSLCNSIKAINNAWDNTRVSCLEIHWVKKFPMFMEIMNSRKMVDEVIEKVSQMATWLAKPKLVSEEDIIEFLKVHNHPVSKQNTVVLAQREADELKLGLYHLELAKSTFKKIDRNCERSSRLIDAINNNTKYYKMILKQNESRVILKRKYNFVN